jgi:thiol-disulfide isomerase/thioredoxin
MGNRRRVATEAGQEMKVQLLVSETCEPCDQAQLIWREVADERVLDFSVVDLADAEGRELAERLRIRTIPALVVDGKLIAIGVQSPDEARTLVARAPLREGLPNRKT